MRANAWMGAAAIQAEVGANGSFCAQVPLDPPTETLLVNAGGCEVVGFNAALVRTQPISRPVVPSGCGDPTCRFVSVWVSTDIE